MALLSVFNDPMLGDLDSAMDRMFDRALGRWPFAAALQPTQHTGRAGGDVFRPLSAAGHAFDVVEKENAYELVADAPGFEPSEINVELQDRVLTISGKHQQEAEHQEGKVWRSERRFQQFSRAFTLPENAKPGDIAASLDRGVLTVSIPKLAEVPKPEPLRIAVQSATA